MKAVWSLYIHCITKPQEVAKMTGYLATSGYLSACLYICLSISFTLWRNISNLMGVVSSTMTPPTSTQSTMSHWLVWWGNWSKSHSMANRSQSTWEILDGTCWIERSKHQVQEYVLQECLLEVLILQYRSRDLYNLYQRALRLFGPPDIARNLSLWLPV